MSATIRLSRASEGTILAKYSLLSLKPSRYFMDTPVSSSKADTVSPSM